MSRIDDLIADLGLGGVELRELGAVGEFVRGRRFTKADIVLDGIGSIHYGEIYTHYGTSTTSVLSYVRADLAPQLRFAQHGDVVIAAVGETVEDVCKAVAWLGDQEVAVHDDCFIFHHTMDPTFVSYCFQTSAFQAQKARHVARAKVKRVSGESLAKLIIPVPPLEIQKEIVVALDSFAKLKAELEVELKAELEARRAQYKHYRDALLTFGERTDSASKQASKQATRITTLGEIATFRRGTAITQRTTTDGKVPVVANGPSSIYSHGESNRSGETIVIARSGAYAGYISFWNKPIFLTDAFSVHPDRNLLKPKFVYYFLQNKQDRIHSMKKGSGVPHVRVKEFEAIEISIPPLEEQDRIVAILDKFDALLNDLSTGLPAEIQARRRQYEHYRERLLTFREAA